MSAATVPAVDFLVIGAYKSGTSTTRALLDAHPDVFVTTHKEPNHLAFCEPGDERHPDGAPNPGHRAAMRDRADWIAAYADRGSALAAGEVSPEYMVSRTAAGRARALLPDARLVAVLRNPIERAYSDFLMYVRDGVETDSFATALDRQDERWAAGKPTGAYLRTGEYAAQIRRWLDVYPAEQLTVLLQEDLRNDPDATARRLFDHIGVRSDLDLEPVEDRNVSGVPTTLTAKAVYKARTTLRPMLGGLVPESIRQAVDERLRGSLARPELEPSDRDRLVEHFADDVAEVSRLIDRPLDHWLTTS